MLKRALLGSLSWLAANQEEVNRLNVFPVPDGDTGTNMLLTLQSAVEDIKDSPATEVGKIARITAHGALMGARGNSGVILSQIFRGFGNAVQNKTELKPSELANAFEEAANAAYRAVIKPTEGTILTVAREAGRAATAAAQDPNATAASVIKAAAQGAKAAVEKTPSQLQILREAGVVDAGGYGLQIMIEGMLKSVEEAGVDLDKIVPSAKLPAAAQVSMELPEEGWGYCTEFLIEGKDLDVERIRKEIAALGNSVLVVGEPELVKVHVHTDDPSRVIALASGHGSLLKLNVGDMSTQHKRILEQSANGVSQAHQERRPNGVGVVAVVAGRGLVEIFRGLGVDAIVEGGQTMNPSTQDMLEAVKQVPYDDVLLLPNNKNVVPAAEQVVGLSDKNVRIVHTHSIPQGVAAMVAFNPERPLKDNRKAMEEAVAHVQTIEVTHAVRDTRSNGMRVKKGDVIALINDHLKHAGRDYGQVVKESLEDLKPDKYELVTIYRGEGASDQDTNTLSEAIKGSFPALEVEVQPGGQEHYPFILSVE